MTVVFLSALAYQYPDIKNAAIYVVLESGGSSKFVAYTESTSSAFKLASAVEDMVGVSGKIASSAKWDGKTAGVTSNGLIVGTYPKVELS